jgi:hypothetical protein
VRRLNKDGSLPPFSWLFRKPGLFRKYEYTKRCSWCNQAFWIVNNNFRVCSTCDLCDEGPDD